MERVMYVGFDPVRNGKVGTVERREPGWLHVRFDGETFTRKCATIALETISESILSHHFPPSDGDPGGYCVMYGEPDAVNYAVLVIWE